MSRMVRKQVYIEAEQEKLLKRRARELGVTEAELVRRGIDQIARPGAWLPLDPKAWEEAKSVIRERMRLRVPQTGRTWTREELHDRWEQHHPD
jgi:hypothetical protein